MPKPAPRPSPRSSNWPTPRPASPVPAPRPQAGPRGSGGAIPDPNASGTMGLPFLTPAQVGNGQADETAYILFHGLQPRRATGKFGPQLVFKVTMDDQDFQLAIDEGSKSHNEIFKAFKGQAPEGQMIVQVVISKNDRPYLVVFADDTLGK